MTKEYKDISANIGTKYDNLCQLIMDNGTMNPEQVLKIKLVHGTDWVVKPFKAECIKIEDYNNEGAKWENIKTLAIYYCTLVEDLTPQPKNPNLIETVEDLYERVKEARKNGEELDLKHERGNGQWRTDTLVDARDGEIYIGDVLRAETAIKLGFKVEVVE